MEKITEQELVERFGNECQKAHYKKSGKLTQSYKQNVLKTAAKYCTVTQLEDGRYKLTNQKHIAITPELTKTANNIYAYTCPLILDYIMV